HGAQNRTGSRASRRRPGHKAGAPSRRATEAATCRSRFRPPVVIRATTEMKAPMLDRWIDPVEGHGPLRDQFVILAPGAQKRSPRKETAGMTAAAEGRRGVLDRDPLSAADDKRRAIH